MVKNVVKLSFGWAVGALLFACSSTNSKPLLIAFSDDSTAIVFKNIDQAGLLYLKSRNPTDTAWNELISILQSPSERNPAIKEMPVEGKIMIHDSYLVFRPAKPFVKGTDYLVITYLNSNFGNLEKLLKGELNYGVMPLQKLVER